MIEKLTEEIERLTLKLDAAKAENDGRAEANGRLLDRALAAEARVADLEAELEGDNGLRARNDAGWAIAKARAEKLNELHGILAADTPEALEKLGGLLADKQLCVVKFVDVLGTGRCAFEVARRESALQGRVAELEAKRLEQESAILTLAAKNIGLDGRAQAAEGNLEATKAMVSELEAERDYLCGQMKRAAKMLSGPHHVTAVIGVLRGR